MPKGTVGHRWQKKKGEWNLKLEDCVTGQPIKPLLELKGAHDATTSPVEIADFSDGTNQRVIVAPRARARNRDRRTARCSSPPRWSCISRSTGSNRGFEGEWPKGYEDDSQPFTPAWQERFTGVAGSVAVNFAREWARTAENTGGKCSVIIGAGVNHWYHNNLIYRAVINALHVLRLRRQERRRAESLRRPGETGRRRPRGRRSPSAATGAGRRASRTRRRSTTCTRTSGATTGRSARFARSATQQHPMAHGHTADKQAWPCGWAGCRAIPQFTKQQLRGGEGGPGRRAPRPTRKSSPTWSKQLKDRKLKFAMEDPDNPECFPRVFYIWRGNALTVVGQGPRVFPQALPRHAPQLPSPRRCAKPDVKEVTWHDKVELGKMDLIVDLNFRMDTSALYSDIVLPAATYYEKNDLNSTDMHSFIHPLQAAVPPCWESKSDWEIFQGIAEETAKLAPQYFSGPVKDIVVSPLMHDTPAEIAQPTVKDWAKGECELIPGKTMPNIKVVTRDYANLLNRFISLGPNFRNNGLVDARHALRRGRRLRRLSARRTRPRNGAARTIPSLRDDKDACDVILHFAAETNGEMAYRAYEAESIKTGIDHTHLAADTRAVRYTFEDLTTQPRPHPDHARSGPASPTAQRTYSAYCQNIEELIPWRTLTGRQHLYLDHEAYVAFGENLPTFKPRGELRQTRDLEKSPQGPGSMVLNYLTPHGKWHIHSTYGDTLRMKTLSRGCYPVWINDKDADLIGIEDNDWIEVYQRPRRGLHAGHRQRAHSARHLPALSRAGAHARRAQIAGARQPAGRRPQQPHPHPPQAAVHDRRLRAVHLRLQLLGAAGRQPRHLRRHQETRTRSFTNAHRTCYGCPSTRFRHLPPRQVHRVPHLQRRLQERVDRPPRRRIHVVEQRRDQARHRLPDALGGPGQVQRRLEDGTATASSDLRCQNKADAFLKLFYNPNQPNLDDYYEPLTYKYEDLFTAKAGDDQPTAVPVSLITGEPMEIKAGPNWDDDLSGSPIYAENDLNLDKLTEEERAQLFEVERLTMFYLPRICNHCANPSCVAACPSGAIYKRGEDGIVLINQEKCRGWRACVAACPYKKIYYNWKTGKSEKCILCFPRLETGQPPACFHSCVGRIRYLGVMLYDADRVPGRDEGPGPRAGGVAAHGVPRPARSGGRCRRPQERHQRGVHRVRAEIAGVQIRDGMEARAAAAHRIPHHADVVLCAAAAAGHGQVRQRHLRARARTASSPAWRRRACRIKYLASLFSAGNEQVVEAVMKKLMAVRYYKRWQSVRDLAENEVQQDPARSPDHAGGGRGNLRDDRHPDAVTSATCCRRCSARKPSRATCSPEACKGCTGFSLDPTFGPRA